MNEQHSRIKSLAISFAVLVFAYAALSYVRTYSSSIEPGTYRSFSVSGEGKVVAVPDVAEFSFSIITEGGPASPTSQGGKDLASLQKTNIEKANKAIDFVKSNGVDKKDIKTEGYSVYPRYTNFSCKSDRVPLQEASGPSSPAIYSITSACPPPEIAGYTITQTLSVKVRDFAKAGDILAGVVSAGANNVSQLNFSIDDRDKVESEARTEAIDKAKVKAEAMARAGGFKLGKLLSIDEGYGGPVYYKGLMAADGRGGASEMAPPPTIEPGSQDIVVTVTLRYEIR